MGVGLAAGGTGADDAWVDAGDLVGEGGAGVLAVLGVGVSAGERVGKGVASQFADLVAGLSVDTPLGSEV